MINFHLCKVNANPPIQLIEDTNSSKSSVVEVFQKGLVVPAMFEMEFKILGTNQ